MILRSLLLSVSAAALLTGLGLEFVRESAMREMVRLAGGLLMILSILLPLANKPFAQGQIGRQVTWGQTREIEQNNEQIVSQAVSDAISSYVEQKAVENGIACKTEIRMNGTAVSEIQIRFQGLTASQRQLLSKIITDDCAIAEEHQKWIQE